MHAAVKMWEHDCCICCFSSTIFGRHGETTRDILIHLNTGFYGDKILYKHFDLTQDSPNKILFHFLWEQNLVQKSSNIFRWPEMCSLGKILAQDFQMAAATKILMRRDKSIAPLLSLGDTVSRTDFSLNTTSDERDPKRNAS